MITEEARARATQRAEALFEFYTAERRSGADALTANERMMEFAKRYDDEEHVR